MLVICNNVLHPSEQSGKARKAIEHLLRIFALNDNKPMSQEEMGKIYRKSVRPYTGEGRTEQDATSSIRAHTSAWKTICGKYKLGDHLPGKDDCVAEGYHRVCQKRTPGSKHRNRLFWIDKSFAKKIFRAKTDKDVDELSDWKTMAERDPLRNIKKPRTKMDVQKTKKQLSVTTDYSDDMFNSTDKPSHQVEDKVDLSNKDDISKKAKRPYTDESETDFSDTSYDSDMSDEDSVICGRQPLLLPTSTSFPILNVARNDMHMSSNIDLDQIVETEIQNVLNAEFNSRSRDRNYMIPHIYHRPISSEVYNEQIYAFPTTFSNTHSVNQLLSLTWENDNQTTDVLDDMESPDDFASSSFFDHISKEVKTDIPSSTSTSFMHVNPSDSSYSQSPAESVYGDRDLDILFGQ